MTWDLEAAVAKGIITPVSELRLAKDEEEDYREGFLLDKEPDILTRGHVVEKNRILKIQDRAMFSDYILCPTKFNFASTVRIYGYVMAFIMKCRKNRNTVGMLLHEGSLTFSVFTSNLQFFNNSSVHYIAASWSDTKAAVRTGTPLSGYFANDNWNQVEKFEFILPGQAWHS